MFSSEIALPLWESIYLLRNTLFLGPHHPKRHLDQFSRFLYGSQMYVVQCVINEEENPKAAPFPWDFVTLSEEDRATAIGNMHKN